MKAKIKYAVVLELEDGETITLDQPNETAMTVAGKQARAVNYYLGRRIAKVHLDTTSRVLVRRSVR